MKNSKEALKFDQDKPRMELLPMEALREVSKVLTYGAAKYEEHNWRGGLEYSRLYGAMLRHLTSFIEGEDTDPETQLSHIAHMVCGGLFLLTFIIEKRAELDNRPTLKRTTNDKNNS